MVFVFGIDVPLIELLFVYVILIIFALVIVLVEIAKLRKLLMLERMRNTKNIPVKDPLPTSHTESLPDIDSNLDKLEKEIEKKDTLITSAPLDPKLVSYVENSLERGLDKETIRENLLAIGWSKEDVEKALS